MNTNETNTRQEARLEPLVGPADQPRAVLLDKSLRAFAHDLRIKACGAWSDVRAADGSISAAHCDLAAAHEARLAAAIDELADLANGRKAQRQLKRRLCRPE